MNKHTLFKFIAPIILLFSGYAQAASSFSNVYIFGDSLSDTGNLASVTQNFPPPFYMNRVSNGPVAVDVLTEQLGHSADASLYLLGLNAGNNYSVARANALGEEVIDLGTQILSFQANHGFVAPSDALYVIFIGGNDLRAARDLLLSHEETKSMVKAVANEVRLAIESLSLAGAKSFLVVNAPNIGLIPETQLIANFTTNPNLIKRATKISKQYRKALHQVVEHLEEQKSIEISEFDLFRFFNKLVKNADKHGFTNSTDACFSSETFNFHPDCNMGLNFDQFIFFDEIHPTTRVHAMAGKAMARAVLEEGDGDDDDDDAEDEDDN